MARAFEFACFRTVETGAGAADPVSAFDVKIEPRRFLRPKERPGR